MARREPLCDQCPEPATTIVRDFEEIEPVNGCEAFEPRRGSLRRGCDDHPPRPAKMVRM